MLQDSHSVRRACTDMMSIAKQLTKVHAYSRVVVRRRQCLGLAFTTHLICSDPQPTRAQDIQLRIIP